MKHLLRTLFVFILGIGISSIVHCSQAIADTCDNLDNNTQWTSTMKQLSDAYEKGEWNDALKHAILLERICEEVPFLNYMLAQIYHKKGEKNKYIFYLTKATQNTDRYITEKNFLEKIWFEKYIALHPDADPKNIEAMQLENQTLRQTLAETRQDLETLKNFHAESLQDTLNSVQKQETILLWSSIGVTATGVLLTATGAGLVLTNRDKSVGADKDGYYTKSVYNAGWGLTGSGIAITLLGSALTGYFAYRYSKHQTSPVAIMLSPKHTALQITF